jgi:transcription elongation GreA/GreB family factor
MSLQIGLGSQVQCTLSGREQLFTLVTPADSCPSQGRLSVQAPIGRALLGHHAGETLAVRTPAGVRELSVLSVS